MPSKTPLQKRLRRIEVRLQRHPLVQGTLQALLNSYVRIVHRTTRWQYDGVRDYGPGGDQSAALLCAWHETLPGVTHALRVLERPTTALASDHPDGLLVVKLLRRMGFACLLMQTSRDKTGALRDALRVLRADGSLAVTPDGPMGPAREVKPGAVTLGALSGAPLIPFGYATTPALRLPTWDRMLLPLPFGRGVLTAGPGLAVTRGEDEAQACARLGVALEAEMARAEALLHRKPVEPR